MKFYMGDLQEKNGELKDNGRHCFREKRDNSRYSLKVVSIFWNNPSVYKMITKYIAPFGRKRKISKVLSLMRNRLNPQRLPRILQEERDEL
jgi:hypothetical protein